MRPCWLVLSASARTVLQGLAIYLQLSLLCIIFLGTWSSVILYHSELGCSGGKPGALSQKADSIIAERVAFEQLVS